MNWLSLNKETIFNGKDEKGNRYLSQFLSDYKKTFNPDIINAGCKRCLNDYYLKFTKHLAMSDKTEKTKSGYALKAKYEGIPLSFGSRTFVTNNNITNEMGDELLKNHPAGEKLFTTIPKKQEKELTRLEELNSMKREELDEIAKDLELNPEDYKNKGLIAEAIEKKEVELSK